MQTQAVIERMSRKPRLAICRYLALGAECAAKETALLRADGASADASLQTWPEAFDDYVFLQYLYETGEGWTRPTSHGQIVKIVRETVAAVDKAAPEARALLTRLMTVTRDGFSRMSLEPDDWRHLSEEELLTRNALLHVMAKAADILELAALGRGAGAKTDLSDFKLAPVFMQSGASVEAEPRFEERVILEDFAALSANEQSVVRLLSHLTLCAMESAGRENPEACEKGLTPQALRTTERVRPILKTLARAKPDETLELEYRRLLVDRELAGAVRDFRKRMAAHRALDRDFPLMRLLASLVPWYADVFKPDTETMAASLWHSIFTPRLDDAGAAFCFDGIRADRLADWMLENIDEADAASLAALQTVVNAADHAILTDDFFAEWRQGWNERFPRFTPEHLLDSIRRSDAFLDRFDRRYPAASCAISTGDKRLRIMIDAYPATLRRLRQLGKRAHLPPPFAIWQLTALTRLFFNDIKGMPEAVAVPQLTRLTGYSKETFECVARALSHHAVVASTVDIGPLLNLMAYEDALERFPS